MMFEYKKGDVLLMKELELVFTGHQDGDSRYHFITSGLGVDIFLISLNKLRLIEGPTVEEAYAMNKEFDKVSTGHIGDKLNDDGTFKDVPDISAVCEISYREGQWFGCSIVDKGQQGVTVIDKLREMTGELMNHFEYEYVKFRPLKEDLNLSEDISEMYLIATGEVFSGDELSCMDTYETCCTLYDAGYRKQ